MEIQLEEEQLAKLTPTERRMATESLKKLVIAYSIPTIISMFINALYNVVDRFWVGQIPDVGKEALVGVGLTMPIMSFVLGCAMLVGLGAATCISISLGKRDKDNAEQILGNSLSLSLLLSLFVSVVGLLFKTPILEACGASQATLPYADAYITIILFGAVFQILSFSMNHPIRAAGNPNRFASTQLIGAIANMILDPVLIIYFKMGVQGAAIATIFSMFLSTCWVFSYYFSEKSLLRLRKKNIFPRAETANAIVSIGFSPFLMQVAASLVAFVVNRILKHYGDLEINNGDTAIGAMTIINSVIALILMPIFGINQGTQPIVGFNYGAGNYARVKEAYRWSLVYSVVVAFFGVAFVEVFASDIVRAFNDSPDLVSIGSFGLRVAVSAMVFVAVQAPTVNFFTAIGRAKISVFISLLRQVIMLVPAYVVISAFFGLHGVWFAMPISDIASTAVAIYYVIREFKMLKISMKPIHIEQNGA